MNLAELREKINNLPDDTLIGIFVPDNSQGHSVSHAVYNSREEIFWLNAVITD